MGKCTQGCSEILQSRFLHPLNIFMISCVPSISYTAPLTCLCPRSWCCRQSGLAALHEQQQCACRAGSSASPSTSQCARSGAVGLGQTRAAWTDRGLGCVRRGGSIGIVPLGLEQLLESYAEGKLCGRARAAHPAATQSLIRVGSAPSVSDGDGGKGGSAQACARQIRSWIIHVAPKALDTLLGSAGRTIRSTWHTRVLHWENWEHAGEHWDSGAVL